MRRASHQALVEANRRIALLQQVALAANGAATIDGALHAALEQICAYMAWPVGHVYARSSTSPTTILTTGIWHLADAERFRRLRDITMSGSPFTLGADWISSVFRAGSPSWLADLTQAPELERAKVAADLGVQSVYAAPVQVGNDVEMVMEFFAEEAVPPDPPLLELMTQIATQVGRAVERKRTEAALRKNEALLQKVLEMLPVGVWLLGAEGKLAHGNSEGQRIWGGAAYYGIESTGLFHGWRLPGREPITGDQWSGWRAIRHGDTTLNEEIEIEAFDGQHRTILSSALPLYDDDRQILGAIVTNLDVTQRVQAERALHESEQYLRTIFQNTPGRIIIFTRTGVILRQNREIDGHSLDESAGFNIYDALSEEDAAKLRLACQQASVTGATSSFEYADGAGTIWFVRVVSLRSAGREEEFLLLATDVTERRRMEAELLEVRRRLDEGREAERLYLAQELHDLPMQELYSAQFLLARLKHLIHEPQTLALVQTIGDTLLHANQMLRDLCNELRPPVLERFGLGAALRFLVDHLQAKHPDLALHLDLPAKEPVLSSRQGLALFRICQQALSNVVQHAAAGAAYVRLVAESGRLTLEVRDDGQGFVVPDRWLDLARANHLGLAGSAERAEAIGADYKIISAPGAGTTVRVTLPLSDFA
jgi:PAS domain S-box-containing protein